MTDPIKDVSRSMPFSEDAEKGLLSCFLHNPGDLLNDAQSTVPEDMFYHPSHRILYALLLAFNASGKPVEYIAVSQHARDQNLMEKIGGEGMLAELLDFVPTPTHYGYYKGILRDKWLLRRHIAACQAGIEAAFTPHDSVTDLLLTTETTTFEILQEAKRTGEQRSGPKPARIIAAEWMETMEETMRNVGNASTKGIPTLFPDLDRSFNNFDDLEGEVVTIAGRPGMGKTAMMNTLVHNIAVMQKIPTVVFSIEMTQNQLMPRLILGPLGIDTSKAMTGMFSRGKNGSPDEVKMMGNALVDFGRSPLWCDWSSSLNTADLRLRVQTLKRQHGIRAVFIDYLRLVKPVGKSAQAEERLHLTEVMETARWLAKEMKVVVFMLVQMNRDSDKSPGKPPVLADLAGSAAIEQDSHFVFFLHRPSFYFPWHKLNDDARDRWVESYKDRRDADPSLWSNGHAHNGEPMACERQDYEEHTLLITRKSRRGPQPEFWLRFRPEQTVFQSRTAKLFSNNKAERQVGYDKHAA